MAVLAGGGMPDIAWTSFIARGHNRKLGWVPLRPGRMGNMQDRAECEQKA
jgi:hypothetical protein